MQLKATLKRIIGGSGPNDDGSATPSSAEVDVVQQILKDEGVPFTTLADAACKACDDPCDNHLGSYPSRFNIDTTSRLLGTAKPYGRQVIISTGATNWPKEVTEESGSLAELIHEVNDSLAKKSSKGEKESWPGLFATSSFSRLAIHNGSHHSISSHDPAQHTVIVLPDFKFVTDVRESREDAKRLWSAHLDLDVGRAGIAPSSDVLSHSQSQSQSTSKSWPLPYDAVILICSHKRRDNKCGIAAPILQNAFTTVLNARQWEVHTEVDDSCMNEPSLEDISGSSAEERDLAFVQRLQASSSSSSSSGSQHEKRALILNTSHIGGHKFAGNIVVYWPSGSAVWYGRVSPKEVTAVVDETVVGGRVIPELLRAGVNIAAAGKASLNDW
ncbi:hypothetical protein BS47DRAFT_1349174 [Hydnum rufescens UP504]|uniref:Sucrase n=1 Tax=Hydnum rufescens UP504 TaxID=1448309 RepID=A0A9P6APD6_9AGAM|nr:hypothetical protein BS47DRAFT_1349174 [Hydnum rufescens UP504]